ncbi:MAG: hypothetical protein QF805_16965 [Pirellulaceae bacterium]|jgi:hypothetical protein|nr:hypothetical protein [Pirellulaceae bacterium]
MIATRAVEQFRGHLRKFDGSGWNEFWFAPADPLASAVMRVVTGLIGLYVMVSHTPDLVEWFGRHGLLSVKTVGILASGQLEGGGPPSVLNGFDSSAALYAVHSIGLAAFVALTVGFFSRTANAVALVAILSYAHRAPMLSGLIEPVLIALLLYLLIAPSGAAISFDRRRATSGGAPSWLANFSIRLMQVHLCAFYAMMALTKLGNETWWMGEAAWWLAAQQESRIINLTFLHGSIYLINGLTHLIVMSELSFAVLAWSPKLRPFAMLFTTIVWLVVAMLSGQLGFCLTMILANLAFIPSATWREVLAVEAEPAANAA